MISIEHCWLTLQCILCFKCVAEGHLPFHYMFWLQGASSCHYSLINVVQNYVCVSLNNIFRHNIAKYIVGVYIKMLSIVRLGGLALLTNKTTIATLKMPCLHETLLLQFHVTYK